jgi:hypothetical protein
LSIYRSLKNLKIVDFNPGIKGGSNRHGVSLNYIFNFVDTTRTAIIEPDCVLLSSGWNQFNKEALFAKKMEREDIIIYHVCFMIFDTKKMIGVDFCPGTSKTRKSGKSYGVFEDVGWRISERFGVRDIDLLTFVDCKTGNGKYFNKNFQSDEFWKGDIPIVAHFGRGSNISGKNKRNGFKSHEEQLKEWKNIAEGILRR